MISKNIEKMDVSWVRKMFEMASSIENPINLTIWKPDFDVPEQLKKEAINAILDWKNQYTPNAWILRLRKAIQTKLKNENNIKIDTDEIIVTWAVSWGLSVILTTILNKEDEVILFDPYFVWYKQLVLQNGAVPVYVNVNSDFSLDLKEFESKITTKTKAIIINTPNNPTWKVYTEWELKTLANICEKHNILIISDEIYEKFIYEKSHFSIWSIYKNTITLNWFSKAYAMTWWRIWYMCWPKNIIEQAWKVQQFNFVSAPTPFQYACIKALEFDLSDYVEKYKQKRDIIFKWLNDYYEINKSEWAFYCFVKYPYEPKKFIKKCLENKLLIVPWDIFSDKNEFFRISFANDNQTLKRAVNLLNSFV